jgi:CheY-like chemotaxis protein
MDPSPTVPLLSGAKNRHATQFVGSTTLGIQMPRGPFFWGQVGFPSLFSGARVGIPQLGALGSERHPRMSSIDMSTDVICLAGRNIMIVEDDSMISMLLEEMLNELGCTDVCHAADAAGALAVIDRKPPCLALLDVNLGGANVDSVVERLSVAGIPFVFATGYGRSGVPAKWSTRQVLQKPFRLEALSEALTAAQAEATASNA